MPRIRPPAILVLLLVLLAVLAFLLFGRGKPDTGSSPTPSPSRAESASPIGSSADATPAASTVEQNRIHYWIDGDLFSAEGIAEFDPAHSSFAGTGWIAYFTEVDDTQVEIRTHPGALVIDFGDPYYGTSATVAKGCTIDITRNDATGFAGTFTCQALPGVYTGSGAQGGEQTTADFHGTFEAHLANG